MKTLAPALILTTLLATCGPLSVYYKTGVSVSRLQTDTTACEVEALGKAPVANELRQSAPIYYPSGHYCRAGGCWYRPGYWSPGPVYSVDVNKNLRARVMDQCMASKGYQPVTIPACSSSIRSQVAPGRTTTLPPLQGNSCFIKNQDGSYQIVNPQISSTQ